MKINEGKAGRQTSRTQNNLIFALDIGTRSIIGLVGTVQDEKLQVLAIDKEEHARRAMIDGQIEDIEQVAKVARHVKERLENKLECSLTNVCVAAAGRALKTQKAFCEMEFEKPQRIDEEIIGRLEAGAIEKAEEAFAQEMEQEGRQFFLVGYTVTQYLLDNYPISDLLDHQGQRVSADVIATFLPSEVVESLYTTMGKVGLEVASLTLEPIAAINAAIPENIRLLNLALVDIGAGTSDIAISRDGSIVGYTMATVAGDEITEALMKSYLVDFQTAERMKIDIQSQENIEFTDILGLPHTVANEEARASIDGSFKTLCKEIAEKILAVNGNAPSAVFLAGGGSKLADMRECVAKYLEMDLNRVAIAGNNFSVNAVSDEYDLNNPEYATPLGIAVSAGLNMINDSCHVMLNGKRSKLFRSGSLTVLDILMMNGYRSQDLLQHSYPAGRQAENISRIAWRPLTAAGERPGHEGFLYRARRGPDSLHARRRRRERQSDPGRHRGARLREPHIRQRKNRPFGHGFEDRGRCDYRHGTPNPGELRPDGGQSSRKSARAPAGKGNASRPKGSPQSRTARAGRRQAKRNAGRQTGAARPGLPVHLKRRAASSGKKRRQRTLLPDGLGGILRHRPEKPQRTDPAAGERPGKLFPG